ncbi:MAG: PD40 domain-containing protein [Acidobacteria bacterium]|nr:PD40 domain-containing protein [Acidobacteriota bacterium]
MIKWIAVVPALALFSMPQAPPPTEVYLAGLSMQDGRVAMARPENISNSPGYDNQPFFTPDGAALLFTSARGAVMSACGSPQTDIYRYDLATRAVTQVTDTPECEYSPTVTPDGGISVIRVEGDGTQRLWRFSADGKNPALVLADVKPVGYHAWLDKKTLALFVLGQPATLQIARTGAGQGEILATNIGQSIVRMPGGGASFVQQDGTGAERTLTVTQVTLENGTPVTKRLTTVVPGATQAHLAWLPDGTLLMAHDGWLHAWRSGASNWDRITDLGGLGLRNVTRLAVSPKGERIAVVAVPQ